MARELEEMRDRLDELAGQVDRQKLENRVSLRLLQRRVGSPVCGVRHRERRSCDGPEVDIFVTFWAAAALRDATKHPKHKSTFERLMGTMLPAGPGRAPLSKMNFGGLGKLMLQHRMKNKGIDGLDQLIARAQEMGARIHICEMSADLLGFRCDELIGDGSIDPCGVASFLGTALRGRPSSSYRGRIPSRSS